MKIKSVMLAGVLAIGATFTGCSKDPLSNLTDEESRIYITDYDSSANFTSYKTFSISDSVTVVNNGQASRQITATDQSFIDAVKARMQANGYILVSKNANPDLGVNVTRIYSTSTGIISYDNYYNDYYGSYYDPYYWGYGGYGYYSPYSYATYSIEEGALSIDLLDLKNAASKNKIDILWTGLIRGTGIFNSSTAATQIKALFDQSSYLKSE